MAVSTALSELSELALVACDSSYFTNTNPVASGSPLAPLDEGDPTVIPRFDIAAGFFETSQFVDPPGVSTGFKAIAYENNSAGNAKEVIIAFGGCDGGLLSNSSDWVSSTQHLGWNQWIENKAEIFRYLNDLPVDTKITFTGQSLGGALAQYAAYEWIKSKLDVDATFDKSRVNLITFNGLGGYVGLVSNLPSYQASVLDGLGQAAHFVITGDMASRLGGDPTVGIGHVGGQMYLLDYRTVNPKTFDTVKMDLVEAHRIETGFYAGLSAGFGFTVAQDLFSTTSTSPQQWYFQMSSLQNTAGLLGGLINGRDVGRAQSYPRLLAGLMAGMTFGDQGEWTKLMRAFLNNEYEAGKLSHAKFKFWNDALLPANLASKPLTAVIYSAATILAGLGEALDLGFAGIQAGLTTLKEFLQPQSSNLVMPEAVSQNEFSQKAALVLAASGTLPGSNALQQELASLNISPDDFAQRVWNVDSLTWRTALVSQFRDKLATNQLFKMVEIANAFEQTMKLVPQLDSNMLATLAQERDSTIQETAQGIANTFSGKTLYPNVSFTPSGPLTFPIIQQIIAGYTTKLTDTSLSAAARADANDAIAIVERAAQTPVIQSGTTNPFDTPNFDPSSAGPLSVDIQRNQGQTLTLSLPYEAGEGGEKISLQLQGNEANGFVFLTNQGKLTPNANGVVNITVPEGEQQYTFNLLATNNATTNSALTLSAIPLDQNGQAAGASRLEATVQLTAPTQTNGFPTLFYPAVNGVFDAPPFGGFGPDTDFIPGPGGLGIVDGRGNVNYNIVAPEGSGETFLHAAAGNDTIVGSNARSTLAGGGGNDSLTGGDGGNVIMGDWRDDGIGVDLNLPRAGAIPDGQDYLVSGAGSDVMGGGGGNDVLIGGAGNDAMSGDALVEGPLYVNAQGNPVIFHDGSYVGVEAARGLATFLGVLHPGDDFLDGGDGNDVLFGDGGNDTLYGGTGDDSLTGDTPTDLNSELKYPQPPGNDFLDGGSGKDSLDGGGGDDTLMGGEGNDTLTGGKGNDLLEGGAGSDTYVFNIGDGQDTMTDSAPSGDANIIIFGAGVTKESVTLNQDLIAHKLVIAYGNQGDTITLKTFDPNGVFGNSTVQSLVVDGFQYSLAQQLPPSGFVDGTNAGNRFANNTITTGPADDFIQGGLNGMTFNAGAGDDTVYGGDGSDVVHGGTGNNSLFGGGGDDQIYAEGANDTVDGGKGNDQVTATGGGTYTYLFGAGGGQDVIDGSRGGTYVVRLAGNITSNDLSVGRSGEDITLTLPGGQDSLTLQGLASNPSLQIQLSNGTVLTQKTLPLPGGTVTGTTGNDSIRTGATNDLITAGAGVDFIDAGPGDDTVDGGDGNDMISGGTGANQLIGGTGNDQIFSQGGVGDVVDAGPGDDMIQVSGASAIVDGGSGNDMVFGAGRGTYTYLYGLGGGQDMIDASQGGTFTVQLTGSITPSDVAVTSSGQDLMLRLAGSADTLALQGFYTDSAFTVRFPDGTVWDRNDLYSQLPEGTGTIYTTVNTTLPPNIQGLVLLSGLIDADGRRVFLTPPPTIGIGNDLDNFIQANSFDNLLDGGLGNDTLVAGQLQTTEWGSTSVDDRLVGGPGNDSYYYDDIFGGVVTIVDDTSTGDTNILYVQDHPTHFGEKHTVSLALEGAALTLVFTPESGRPEVPWTEPVHKILIPNFNPNDAFTPTAINQIVINAGRQDEVAFTYQQLIEGGITINGTGPNKLVTGTNADDRITGLPGDTLSGGIGNDAYFFNRGGGTETITDTAVPDAMNAVTFGPGIEPGDLTLVEEPNALTIQVGTSGDQLTLAQFDLSGLNGSQVVGALQFAGGLQISLTDLLTNTTRVENTVIQGTDNPDQIFVIGANDTVLAGAGDDTVLGGPGQIQLFGGDGNDILAAGSGNASLDGGNGDDILYGGSGRDTLVGGPGQDAFYPGSGDTTYLFNVGDGQDFINVVPGAGTHLVFGPGISLSDLNDMRVDDSGVSFGVGINDAGFSSDSIHIVNAAGQSTPSVTATFADGTTVNVVDYYQARQVQADQVLISTTPDETLMGGAGNSTLIGGTGNSTLIAGSGNSTLVGGPGHTTFVSAATNALSNALLVPGAGGNTYIIPPGGGRTVILPNTNVPLPGASNDVRFAGAYSSFSPTLGVGSLDIHFASGGVLVIEGFDPNNAERNPGIDTFEFTDRTFTYDQFLALGFDISATGQGQVVNGTSVTDRLVGTHGNNTLNGGAGNDTFTGGPGDVLIGGSGDDIYRFRVGDGSERIQDTALPTEGNRIEFGVGITQSNLTLTQDQLAHTLMIQVGTSGTDQLMLQNFDPTNANGSLVVGTLVFVDGNTTSLADLLGVSVNPVPTVANPLTDQTVQEDAPFGIQVPANTFVDENPSEVLAYSAVLANGNPLPTWLRFDEAAHTFTGTPDDAQVGSLDLRVIVTDTGDLTASDVFTLTIQNVNEAPTVGHPLVNQTVLEDAPFSIQIPANTFADEDAVHGDTLTYSATRADGSALPSWLSFDVATRTFTGTPDDAQVGTVNLTVKATDTGGLDATNAFALTVQNVNEAPVVANPLLDQSTQAGQNYMFSVPTATFADPDAGDTLTYTATLTNGNPLPAWLTFNGTTRTFNGAPTGSDAGLVSLKVTSRDGGNLSVADVFDLTVVSSDQVLTGTSGNDVLTGGAGNDQFFGLAGNDTLNGLAGNDLLDGGSGADTMRGGLDNDTYIVDNVGDAVTENSNEGIDTVQSSLTYTLGTNIENLTLSGAAAINAAGNALNNVLVGNSGNNTLTGGAGNDRLDGGAGNDTMVGGTGDDTYVVTQAGDVVTENANEGTDTVESSVTYSLGSNIENLMLTGTANINGTGSSANNLLIGNSGNNALDGGSGNDAVDGGGGNDSVQGGSGDDTVLGGLGDDTLSAGSGNDVLDGGDGTDTLDGGSGDDILRGGTGNDTIAAGSGADQLTGGLGNDTLNGGSGNDLYNFVRGDGQDAVADSDSSQGNQDKLLFGTTINPLDLVISRQANDLRLAIHGTTDQLIIQNWYTSPTINQIEDLQAGNGQHLLNTQVDQLIQAMASFSQQSGLSWDRAIDQRRSRCKRSWPPAGTEPYDMPELSRRSLSGQ